MNNQMETDKDRLIKLSHNIAEYLLELYEKEYQRGYDDGFSCGYSSGCEETESRYE